MAAPRKVTFFVTELARGGAETQLYRVALGLKRRGWTVSVVSLMAPSSYVESLEAAGVAVHDLGLERGRPRLKAVVRAVRILRDERPDVVCAFLFHATVVAVLAASAAGRVPVVSSIRDPSSGGQGRLRLLGWLLRTGVIRLLVPNSHTVASQLVRSGSFDPSQVRTIVNGLELSGSSLDETSREAKRQELGVAHDQFLWLHVGNFQPFKDHPTLLDGFKELRRSHPEATLRLVGRGDAPAPVRARLQAPELELHVAHLGERRDVLELMEAADALVLASSSEGTPNVLMEAHSVETPVVATRVGGVPELVEHEASGLLAAPRDPAGLCAAMRRMVDASPDQRASWARAGRAHMEANYELERVVDHWERVLAEVANG